MTPLTQEESFSIEKSCANCDVPTKLSSQGASCSCSIPMPMIEGKDHTEADSLKFGDAFLYYSNDEIRMKTLELQDIKDANTMMEPSRQERKTRISFELDPFLILEDKMDEMFDEEDALSGISYDDFRQGGDSKMNLLADLLGV
eukprot:CAMPEP_0196133406 /NCGR_PEP_ID=MMETSP0910-20130528/2645_1 /TAXON_ID=49265 /ORGANISM="Thalassiosira rotula, Strain GSO102" /LENGTH=143 /DNA_ID=CAMNT_0041393131 /DNA_START=40 /DNA_END=471 /DNA_ORIENTATION=+